MERKKLYLPQIENIIAIASGKGGVGKSTVAYNLAILLSKQGFKIGILDADIYGPSIPTLMGQQQKKLDIKEGKIIPLKTHDVYAVSMGLLIEANKPVMWRGPMLQTAIKQFLIDVSWPELDFLIIDMPPGTGDAHLTVAQSMALLGVILVSTPQNLSLIDAIKCLKTFQALNVPILGMIENMSGLVCPCCHHEINVFKKETVKRVCSEHEIPYLGSIPLSIELASRSDEGKIISPKHEEDVYKSYIQILNNLLKTPHL